MPLTCNDLEGDVTVDHFSRYVPSSSHSSNENPSTELMRMSILCLGSCTILRLSSARLRACSCTGDTMILISDSFLFYDNDI